MKIKYFVLLVATIAVVGVAYYGISPIFRQVRVDEPMPQASAPDRSAQVVASATVIDTLAHPASGTAHIIRIGETSYLRYENFTTLNGPDLYVYLAKDKDAKEFISLGRVRATEGNINYEIPAGIDIADYPYALTWCKAFSVLFNYAYFDEAQI